MMRETKRKQSLRTKRKRKLSRKTRRKNNKKQTRKPKRTLNKKKRKTKKGGRPIISNRQSSNNLSDIVNEEREPSVSSEETPTVLDDSFDTFQSFSDDETENIISGYDTDNEHTETIWTQPLRYLISHVGDPEHDLQVKALIREFPDHLEGVFEEMTVNTLMSNINDQSGIVNIGNKLKQVIEIYIDEKIPNMEQSERREYIRKMINPFAQGAARRLMELHPQSN